MRKNLFRTLLSALFIVFPAEYADAQGIVINKTNGQKIYYKASEVESIGVYGHGEKPGPEPQDGKTYTVNGVDFVMVYVEGGTFRMGFGDDPESDEAPDHNVTLSSFCIGTTEVTQELTGKNFRLPTEAEWEYAAQGGKQSEGYTYSGGDVLPDVAWVVDNSSDKTHEVATKQPNELGLYDMNGNVWEWCQDWYGSYGPQSQYDPSGPETGLFRIFRGGAWGSSSTSCRITYRNDDEPTFTYNALGLRLAM